MTRLLNGLIGLFALFVFLPADVVAQPAAVSTGGFENQESSIDGGWRIETRDDGRYLVFDDDFRTRRGPDLKIFLSIEAAANVTGDNAANGLFLAELESHRGTQAYRLPDDLDLEAYASVVIHCERFSKLWGAGDL
jgi:hypothetical protein